MFARIFLSYHPLGQEKSISGQKISSHLKTLSLITNPLCDCNSFQDSGRQCKAQILVTMLTIQEGNPDYTRGQFLCYNFPLNLKVAQITQK